MRQPLSDKLMIASVLVILAILFDACSHGSVGVSDSGATRKESPVAVTRDVQTLISDSGITRYRIEAPLWQIFDKADTPYQEFPEGIYLEQFDQELNVQASMEADYAYYDENAQEWRLIGNVHAMNRKGEMFDTPFLRWTQKTHRVSSDSVIHITREKSIITGYGFDSNEEMSEYIILKPTGVFPIEDEE